MTTVDKLGGRKTLRVAGILEDFEKDRVKDSVNVVDLFESFGVQLTKQGSGYSGLCPFHDDKNPSLSVDREAGLYHCFGCGASGDAFTLVEKLRGCGFKDALEFLRSWTVGPSGGRAVTSPSEARGSTKSAAAEPASPPNQDESGDSVAPQGDATAGDVSSDAAGEDAQLLDTICERYERALAESSEARAYLESRGLFSPETLRRFRVGYSDGKLADVVGAEQRAALVKLGVLTKGGHELLGRCIVVPLMDETGRVAGFYGRAIDERAKVPHRYLPGPHRGLANREAARAYRDRLVLTEAVLDALALDVLGIHNAVPCYGVNGFTPLHEQLFKDERVKEVVVAFDADEAGQNGIAAVAERLAAAGITALAARPSVGKDWNEYLQAGGTREGFEASIAAAVVPAAPEVDAGDRATPDTLTMTKEGGRYRFERPGARYRMHGVRDQFTASLRVSLRLEVESADIPRRSYVDTVDLYSARSRAGYAAAAGLAVGLDASLAERDLLAMLDALEAERDNRLATGLDASEPHELTENERAAGMDLLTDPALVERIESDLGAMGYVGEGVNKLLVYLAATSRKLPDPISVIVASQSASGKSYLIDTVKALMPEEDVVSMTSLSDQALNYLGEQALMHKFLVMGEAVHAESVEHQIREMLSGKELSRLVVTKDERTGELTSRMVRKPVVVSLAMSTTRADMNPENASRSFVLSTDESEAQTQAVQAAQRMKYSLERLTQREARIPAIVARHHAAQRLLEPVGIVNPYAHLLSFPARMMRTRRDHERFLDLIAAVCFLRQFQKERHDDGRGGSYILCDLDDYRVAYRIMSATLPATLSTVPRSAQELYDAVRVIARKKARAMGLSPEDASLSQREIREGTGQSAFLVKSGLRTLADLEYLSVAGSRQRGSRNAYRLVCDEPLTLVDLSAIPEPEALAALAASNGISL